MSNSWKKESPSSLGRIFLGVRRLSRVLFSKEYGALTPKHKVRLVGNRIGYSSTVVLHFRLYVEILKISPDNQKV